MPKHSQFQDLVLLKDLQPSSSAETLRRVHFGTGIGGQDVYNEAWLQKLIMSHPGLLSISEIEPAYESMVPICTELPMQAGFVDNLFVTPSGDLALVECKLWRNPEARRKVVAQIIDYVSELTNWNYEKLESAISRANSLQNSSGTAAQKLFDMVSAGEEIDETAFHDAVSRNLKRGRVLLLIVGDGIREGLETMVEFLQQHAGLDFRLSMVEVALFKLPLGFLPTSPEAGFIAQSRILARTTNISRGVVTVNDSRIEIAPPSLLDPLPLRSRSLTEEQFFQELEPNSPGISERLSRFLAELATCNVNPEYGAKTLTLRWFSGDRNLNLGTIVTKGEIWMDYHAVQARNINRLEASRKYLEDLAALVPGAQVKPTKSGAGWNLADRWGHALRANDLLADEARINGWIKAITRFQAAVGESEEG